MSILLVSPFLRKSCGLARVCGVHVLVLVLVLVFARERNSSDTAVA